ncbi:MAG: ATP-binding protein, partial [Elusimicrobiota bacterium]
MYKQGAKEASAGLERQLEKLGIKFDVESLQLAEVYQIQDGFYLLRINTGQVNMLNILREVDADGEIKVYINAEEQNLSSKEYVRFYGIDAYEGSWNETIKSLKEWIGKNFTDYFKLEGFDNFSIYEGVRREELSEMIASGRGKFLSHLLTKPEVEGLVISEEIKTLARRPQLGFYERNRKMIFFETGKKDIKSIAHEIMHHLLANLYEGYKKRHESNIYHERYNKLLEIHNHFRKKPEILESILRNKFYRFLSDEHKFLLDTDLWNTWDDILIFHPFVEEAVAYVVGFLISNKPIDIPGIDIPGTSITETDINLFKEIGFLPEDFSYDHAEAKEEKNEMLGRGFIEAIMRDVRLEKHIRPLDRFLQETLDVGVSEIEHEEHEEKTEKMREELRSLGIDESEINEAVELYDLDDDSINDFWNRLKEIEAMLNALQKEDFFNSQAVYYSFLVNAGIPITEASQEAIIKAKKAYSIGENITPILKKAGFEEPEIPALEDIFDRSYQEDTDTSGDDVVHAEAFKVSEYSKHYGELSSSMAQAKAEKVRVSGEYFTVKVGGREIEIKIDNNIPVEMREKIKTFITEILEGFSDEDLAILQESIDEKGSLAIAALDRSTHLFEDHLANGFIGINREFINKYERGEMTELDLKVGLAHELRHEMLINERKVLIQYTGEEKWESASKEQVLGKRKELIDEGYDFNRAVELLQRYSDHLGRLFEKVRSEFVITGKRGDLSELLEYMTNIRLPNYWKNKFSDVIRHQFRDMTRPVIEAITNAIDAMSKNEHSKEIHVSIEDGKFVVRDQGIGMDLEDILTKLLIPHVSGQEDQLDAIGQFGVGFYSLFRYLEKPNDSITVNTYKGNTGYSIRFFLSDGEFKFNISEIENEDGKYGTTVTVEAAGVKAGELTSEITRTMPYNTKANILLKEGVSGGTEIKVNDLSNFDIYPDDKVKLIASRKTDGQKKSISLTLNGVVLFTMEADAINVPDEVAVEISIPSLTPRGRNDIEVNDRTVDAMKKVIDIAVNSGNFAYVNALVPLVKRLNRNAPVSLDSLENYLKESVTKKMLDENTLYLPDTSEFRRINHDGNIVFVHTELFGVCKGSLERHLPQYRDKLPGVSDNTVVYIVNLERQQTDKDNNLPLITYKDKSKKKVFIDENFINNADDNTKSAIALLIEREKTTLEVGEKYNINKVYLRTPDLLTGEYIELVMSNYKRGRLTYLRLALDCMFEWDFGRAYKFLLAALGSSKPVSDLVLPEDDSPTQIRQVQLPEETPAMINMNLSWLPQIVSLFEEGVTEDEIISILQAADKAELSILGVRHSRGNIKTSIRQNVKPYISIRENAQNSRDEVLRIRKTAGPEKRNFTGSLDITAEVTENGVVLTSEDNMGMSLEKVVKILLTPGVSDKKDLDELVGQFGMGFFTNLKDAEEATLKTSTGDGRVVKVKFSPLKNTKGEVIDIALSIDVLEENYKGTSISVTTKCENPEGEIDYIRNLAKKYVGLVDNSILEITFNGEVVNENGISEDELLSRIKTEYGNISVYHVSGNKAVSHRQLYLTELEDYIGYVQVDSFIISFLEKYGIVIDLPEKLELIGDRSDIVNRNEVLKDIRSQMAAALITAAARAFSSGQMANDLIPYDYIENYLTYELNDDVLEDAARVLKGKTEEVDFAKYVDNSSLLRELFVCLPVWQDKSLINILMGLDNGSIKKGDLPPGIRNFINKSRAKSAENKEVFQERAREKGLSELSAMSVYGLKDTDDHIYWAFAEFARGLASYAYKEEWGDKPIDVIFESAPEGGQIASAFQGGDIIIFNLASGKLAWMVSNFAKLLGGELSPEEKNELLREIYETVTHESVHLFEKSFGWSHNKEFYSRQDQLLKHLVGPNASKEIDSSLDRLRGNFKYREPGKVIAHLIQIKESTVRESVIEPTERRQEERDFPAAIRDLFSRIKRIIGVGSAAIVALYAAFGFSLPAHAGTGEFFESSGWVMEIMQGNIWLGLGVWAFVMAFLYVSRGFLKEKKIKKEEINVTKQLSIIFKDIDVDLRKSILTGLTDYLENENVDLSKRQQAA